MEKHEAVNFLRNTGFEPLEKHKATDVRSSSDRCCLAIRHLNAVSLAGRWWPVLVTGYRLRLIYLIISCL